MRVHKRASRLAAGPCQPHPKPPAHPSTLYRPATPCVDFTCHEDLVTLRMTDMSAIGIKVGVFRIAIPPSPYLVRFPAQIATLQRFNPSKPHRMSSVDEGTGCVGASRRIPQIRATPAPNKKQTNKLKIPPTRAGLPSLQGLDDTKRFYRLVQTVKDDHRESIMRMGSSLIGRTRSDPVNNQARPAQGHVVVGPSRGGGPRPSGPPQQQRRSSTAPMLPPIHRRRVFSPAAEAQRVASASPAGWGPAVRHRVRHFPAQFPPF